MAHFVFNDGKAVINAVDLSAHCTGIDVNVSTREAEDGPCMGQTAVKMLPVIRMTGPLRVQFKQDFAAAQVHATIHALWAANTVFTYAFKPTSGADATTNPNLTGTGFITSWAPLRGSFGEVLGTEITISPAGATPGLTEDTTP